MSVGSDYTTPKDRTPAAVVILAAPQPQTCKTNSSKCLRIMPSSKTGSRCPSRTESMSHHRPIGLKSDAEPNERGHPDHPPSAISISISIRMGPGALATIRQSNAVPPPNYTITTSPVRNSRSYGGLNASSRSKPKPCFVAYPPSSVWLPARACAARTATSKKVSLAYQEGLFCFHQSVLSKQLNPQIAATSSHRFKKLLF